MRPAGPLRAGACTPGSQPGALANSTHPASTGARVVSLCPLQSFPLPRLAAPPARAWGVTSSESFPASHLRARGQSVG